MPEHRRKSCSSLIGFRKHIFVFLILAIFCVCQGDNVWASNNAITSHGNPPISPVAKKADKRSSVGRAPQWVADSKHSDVLLDSKNLPGREKCNAFWSTLWPWAKKGNLDISSSGVHFDQEQYNEAYKYVANTAYTTSLTNNPETLGHFFLKCMKKHPAQNCAHGAVSIRLIPSFEKYAEQVDALLAQGMGPVCFWPYLMENRN